MTDTVPSREAALTGTVPTAARTCESSGLRPRRCWLGRGCGGSGYDVGPASGDLGCRGSIGKRTQKSTHPQSPWAQLPPHQRRLASISTLLPTGPHAALHQRPAVPPHPWGFGGGRGGGSSLNICSSSVSMSPLWRSLDIPFLASSLRL